MFVCYIARPDKRLHLVHLALSAYREVHIPPLMGSRLNFIDVRFHFSPRVSFLMERLDSSGSSLPIRHPISTPAMRVHDTLSKNQCNPPTFALRRE